MIYYWILFLIPALFALYEDKRSLNPRTGSYPIKFNLGLFLWMIFLTIMIGLRFGVGGDWLSYDTMYNEQVGLQFSEMLLSLRDDPLYNLLNWLSAQLGLGLQTVNLICAFIFSSGLVIFCQNLPRPWLGLLVAVPYLIIVVSMGYTRQSIALGIAFFALIALSRQKILFFTLLIMLAILAHKSAILLLPIAGLAATKNRWAVIAYLFAVGVFSYFIFIEASIEFYLEGYINQDLQSQGALIRLSMNGFPAIIYFLFRKKINLPEREGRLWFWISVLSIFMLVVFPVFPSSSALDRIALYMLPLQIVIFTYIADAIFQTKSFNTMVRYSIIIFYALVQFVWLFYASNSISWLPYRSYLWVNTIAGITF